MGHCHRRRHRRLPWRAHRLCRHSVLHRDAGRTHRLARCRLGGDPRRDRGAHGQEFQADRRRVCRHNAGLHRCDGELDSRPHRLRCHRLAGILNGRRQRRRFKFPLRPMWAEYFLGAAGCLLALGATWLVNCLPLAQGRRRPLGGRNRHHGATRRPLISLGYSLPVLIALGVGVAMTFHGDAHALRPLHLRHRRQSGSGRARRHQHQDDSPDDLRADGRARRRLRLHLLGSPRFGDQCAWASSTSFTSLPQR